MSTALALPVESHRVAEWRAGVEALPVYDLPAPGLVWREAGPGGRESWPAVRLAMLRFLDDWGAAAEAAGWRDIDLFGVHRAAGALRADSTGALVRNWPYRVVALDDRTITVARRETRLVFRGLTNPGDAVPVWAFYSADQKRAS